jgi:predicted Zn-dependent protease
MAAYERALDAEPGNSSAWTNIALIHRDQGREEASRTALQAATDGRSNPFTLIALADVEMSRGDLDAAAKYLRRAKWWYREQPAVYDALARLERRRGDTEKADRHASRAAELRAESHRAGRPAPAS